MAGFFKRLFGGGSSNEKLVQAFWCRTPVKLADKVRTPLGSNVSIVTVCVDIHYSLVGGQIQVSRVQLSKSGGRISGSNGPINVAAERTGEAWFSSKIAPESKLLETVARDLGSPDSELRKIILSNSRGENRGALVRSVADALNSQASPDEIGKLVATAGRGNDIRFSYTKTEGVAETRHVSVRAVSGASIRALDHKDGKVKSFRIDRISNARSD